MTESYPQQPESSPPTAQEFNDIFAFGAHMQGTDRQSLGDLFGVIPSRTEGSDAVGGGRGFINASTPQDVSLFELTHDGALARAGVTIDTERSFGGMLPGMLLVINGARFVTALACKGPDELTEVTKQGLCNMFSDFLFLAADRQLHKDPIGAFRIKGYRLPRRAAAELRDSWAVTEDRARGVWRTLEEREQVEEYLWFRQSLKEEVDCDTTRDRAVAETISYIPSLTQELRRLVGDWGEGPRGVWDELGRLYKYQKEGIITEWAIAQDLGLTTPDAIDTLVSEEWETDEDWQALFDFLDNVRSAHPQSTLVPDLGAHLVANIDKYIEQRFGGVEESNEFDEDFAAACQATTTFDSGPLARLDQEIEAFVAVGQMRRVQGWLRGYI